MNRIEHCFANAHAQGRAARIFFASCGYPTMVQSEEVIETLIAQGGDIIELGMPFSDPIADGAVIQAASQGALTSGATLTAVIEMAARIRKRHPDTGLVLFSYYNPILAYGAERCCQKLRDVGVDGVLVVDLPLEERAEFKPYCDAVGLHFIPLISPTTTPQRAAQIVEGCGGFVYTITARGITGERAVLPPELTERLQALHAVTKLPIAAGFGVSTRAMAEELSRHCEGVVVGSALIRPLLEANDFATGLEQLKVFLRELQG